jgi:hypothetical protein
MNFYMNSGPTYVPPLARGLYQEIAQIEEQHVTHYESLLDPQESWFQRELFHHYNECYLYWSFMQQEDDPRIRRIWELHLAMEIEHVRIAGEMLKRNEGVEPAEILPPQLPEPTRFQENKEYVRDLLANQVWLTASGTEFVPISALPPDARYFELLRAVNDNIAVPSEQVIAEHVRVFGSDFRLQTEGPHPVPALRRGKPPWTASKPWAQGASGPVGELTVGKVVAAQSTAVAEQSKVVAEQSKTAAHAAPNARRAAKRNTKK